MEYTKRKPVSVLISVYEREEPEYLKKALGSLREQEAPPDEIVLVKDGKLGKELDLVIRDFREVFPALRLVELPENVKLGRALAQGLKACRFELVARMDSDDIALPRRLLLQERYMRAHPEISACGGNIAEFEEESKILRVKHMPQGHEELYAYAKLRNPLNHMTVMFRKSDIEAVGGYMHFPGLEDYYLWSRLLAGGFKIANLDEILVEARLGRGFARRRGGFAYFLDFCRLRKLQRRLGLLNAFEWLRAVFVSAAVCLAPAGLRDRIYRIIRKKR